MFKEKWFNVGPNDILNIINYYLFLFLRILILFFVYFLFLIFKGDKLTVLLIYEIFRTMHIYVVISTTF